MLSGRNGKQARAGRIGHAATISQPPQARYIRPSEARLIRAAGSQNRLCRVRAFGRADMHPAPVQHRAIKPAGRGGAVINMIEGKRAIGCGLKAAGDRTCTPPKTKGACSPCRRVNRPSACWSKSPCPSYPVQAESGASISRASMRAASKPARNAARISAFSCRISPLQTRKGSAPKRQGFFDPATGFQQLGPLVGIDDFSAVALCQMIANPLGFMMQIDNNAGHTGVFQPVEQAVKQCPPGNSVRGFGGSSARARMRVLVRLPVPWHGLSGPTSGGLLRIIHPGGPIGCMGFQPNAYRDVSPHAPNWFAHNQDTRQMRPILRLVIAQGQTDKYAGNFQIALRPNMATFAKSPRSTRLGVKAPPHIMVQTSVEHGPRYVNARILQQ